MVDKGVPPTCESHPISTVDGKWLINGGRESLIGKDRRDSISNVHYGKNSDLTRTRKCITLIMEANQISSNNQNNTII
jgi:hypothetical protein